MTTTTATTASPKHLLRLAEKTYGLPRESEEIDLLSEAVRATERLFQELGGLASGTLAPLEDLPFTPLLRRLVAERVVVEAAPNEASSWLLRGRRDGVVRFALRSPRSEELVLLLEIAREAVPLRLSELAWNGVIDRVRAIQRIACCRARSRSSMASRSPPAPSPQKASAGTTSTSSPSGVTASSSRSPLPRATGCRRRSRPGTSWGSAWGSSVEPGSPSSSRG